MGPGGLRGLQILRSGVKSVRGGFDSHAFPPLLALLLAGAGLNFVTPPASGAAPADAPALPASAHEAAEDTTAASDEELIRKALASEDSAAARRAPRAVRKANAAGPARKPSRFDKPRWVMLRSLVVPGWGQAHNRSWLKAIAVAAGEGTLGARLIEESRALDRLKAEVAATPPGALQDNLIDEHNTRLDRYVSRQWLMGGVVIYSLLDAYIDAHFRNFKMEFEGDPALRGGVPRDQAMRVSLRWSF